MLHETKLPSDIDLKAALYLIGEARPETKGACVRAMAKIPTMMVRVQISAADIICAACDAAREANDPETLKVLEDLAQEMRQGKHHVIKGTLNLGHVESVGQLDDALENFRSAVTR